MLDALITSDVVVWACHADARPAGCEGARLRELLDSAGPDHARRVGGRIAAVLTKADLLSPPPWIFDARGRRGSFVPGPALAARLERRAARAEQALLAPLGDLLTAATYPTADPEGRPAGILPADDGRLRGDRHAVRYRGHFSGSVHERYRDAHPEHADVLGRLRDDHRVIPCSARFRYNLPRLLLALATRVTPAAVFRFQRMLDDAAALAELPASAVARHANLVRWDGERCRPAVAGPAC
ncbi:hypothetical protein Sru01_37770 [Sphaerisporangium rufum]|uniref:Uncharacterized protein n=2 Tax=Sphaerisporangium rufum TaxID=1381558 RepID=A0A919V5Y1_9ACTN|nr:hypothetical protein Sru01_37770 [Sphaerisporangium rufum]